MANRVIDEFARGKLMQLDLGAAGIETIPAIIDHGQAMNSSWRPVEVYLNGTALSQSRWPNNEKDTKYLRLGECIQHGETWASGPITVTYKDDTGRAKPWSEEAVKDLFIGGYLGGYFAHGNLRVDSLDAENNTLVTVGGTNYGISEGNRMYFWNLVEEIDMPGESYIDREKKIIYFYPTTDMQTAEVVVSTLDKPMFILNDVNHVTLKGLDFEYTRENAVTASGSHITVDGCKAAHTSGLALNLSGTNITVKNCNIYDTGKGGITISGGDRETLEGSGNVITNNRMHDVSRVYESYSPAININGVGVQVTHNELYNAGHQLISVLGNDHYISYNEIYNAVLEASDMGAVYSCPRDATQMGTKIMYNYFHDNGNGYGGYGSQSVFFDDGSYGPYIYGNIFYRGTLTAEEGGKTSTHNAIKTNGGQYVVVKNNVFVDAPNSFLSHPWNNGNTAYGWWLWIMDRFNLRNHNVWEKMQTVPYASETWVNHYDNVTWTDPETGTQFQTDQWSHLPEMDQVYAQVKDKDAEADAEWLKNFAMDYAPVNGNVFENNVSVKVGQAVYGGLYQANNNYNAARDNGMFVEYGKDFKLSNKGLSTVEKAMGAGSFENLPTEKMGLKPYTEDGLERYVGGRAPTVTSALIGGDVSIGSVITANYSYSDPDNDPEGFSEVNWYLSNSKDGNYEKILGEHDSELYLEESYSDKFIRYEVTPHDSNDLHGEPIVSETVQVGKEESPAKKLEAKISEAEGLNSVIAEGSLYGQAPASAKSAFAAAIEAARAVTSTDAAVLSEALGTLQGAIDTFKAAVNTTVPAVESGATYDIVPFVDVTNITIPADKSGVKVTVPAGMELGEINISGTITVDGEARAISLKIPAGTKVEGTAGTRVALPVFAAGSTPSQTVDNAEKITAVTFGGDLAFSGPVRIEIEGAYSKRTGHIIGGRYTTVSTTVKTDTAEAAQSGLKNRDMVRVSNTSPKLVVWADGLNELVLYDSVSNVTPIPTSPNGGGGNGSYNPGNSNGGSTTAGGGSGLLGGGGSKFIDINNHWAKSDIEEMYSKGIVAGVTENTFEPDRPVTRAEFAALVARALNLTATGEGQEWKDVSSDAWYAPVVKAAANAGIIAGYDGWYRPDDLITREEMAVIIAKAYAFKGGAPKSGAIEMFADRGEISEWAYSYVDTAAAIGILKGMTPTTFVAAANTTRAEATSVLKRLLDLF